MQPDFWHCALPEYSAIVGFIDAIFNELNMGLLIYHAEKPDDIASYRLIYANREASRSTSANLTEEVGKTIFEAFPELRDTRVPALFREVALTGEARRIGIVRYSDARVVAGEYDCKAFPMPQNCVGVLFENLAEQG